MTAPRQAITRKDGVYDIDAAAYHADELADRPSLSRSVAHILCTATPLHAWTAHPRLNPQYQREDDKEAFDIGTVAHDLLLGDGSAVEVIEADSWRTKAAQEARDAARTAGRQPLLPYQWEAVEAMVAAVRKQLEAHGADPPLFRDGRPEQTLVWEEPGGVMCRARLDWLRDDRLAVDDFKTARTSNPEAFSRSLFNYGYDVQAAFYARGVSRLTNVMPEFRFVVVEKTPPYALSVVSLGPAAMSLAQKKVQYAIDLWRACLTHDDWPAYPEQVCWAELPSYEESRWLAKEEGELVV